MDISTYCIYSGFIYKKIRYSIILNKNGILKIRKTYVNLGYVRPIYSCSMNASKVIPVSKSNIIAGKISWNNDLTIGKPIGWVYCKDNK